MDDRLVLLIFSVGLFVVIGFGKIIDCVVGSG